MNQLLRNGCSRTNEQADDSLTATTFPFVSPVPFEWPDYDVRLSRSCKSPNYNDQSVASFGSSDFDDISVASFESGDEIFDKLENEAFDINTSTDNITHMIL